MAAPLAPILLALLRRHLSKLLVLMAASPGMAKSCNGDVTFKLPITIIVGYGPVDQSEGDRQTTVMMQPAAVPVAPTPQPPVVQPLPQQPPSNPSPASSTTSSARAKRHNPQKNSTIAHSHATTGPTQQGIRSADEAQSTPKPPSTTRGAEGATSIPSTNHYTDDRDARQLAPGVNYK